MIEVLISLVSLLGMALVARHESRFFGFTISAVGNILWLVWIFIANTGYAQILLFGGYFIFNAIGMHDEYATWRQLHNFHKKYNR